MNCGFIKHLHNSTGQNKAAKNQDIRWDYICFRTIYFQICDWFLSHLSLTFYQKIIIKFWLLVALENYKFQCFYKYFLKFKKNTLSFLKYFAFALPYSPATYMCQSSYQNFSKTKKNLNPFSHCVFFYLHIWETSLLSGRGCGDFVSLVLSLCLFHQKINTP